MNAGHRALGPIPSAGAALLLARAERPALAIVDLDLRQALDAEKLTRALKKMSIPSIVMSHESEKVVSTWDVAMGCVSKPLHLEDIPTTIDVVAEIIWTDLARTPLPASMTLFDLNER